MLKSIKKSYLQSRDTLAAGGRFAIDGARCAASSSVFEFAARTAKKSPLLATILLTGSTSLHALPKNQKTGLAATAIYPLVALGSQYLNNHMAAQDAAKAPKGAINEIKKTANTALKTAFKYPILSSFTAGIATISAYNMLQSSDKKKKK